MTTAQLRRLLYQGARILGDYQATKRGPTGVARRVARKSAYRFTGRSTARVLRSLGL